MTEYTIEIDEAHELMLEQITAEDSSDAEFLANFVEQSIYNTYQQIRNAESE